MAGLKKRPPVPKGIRTSPTTKRVARLRNSPSPNPKLPIKLGSSPARDASLPPPSSLTPSSNRRSFRNRSAKSNNLPSSPLNNKFELAIQNNLNSMNKAKSSPLKPTATRLNSLPSPSPEFSRTRNNNLPDVSKSSPIRSKRVMFTKELVMDDRIIPTPKKSILKSAPQGPPHMDPLMPSSPTPSSNPTLVASHNASKLEFWTPGNIPRLSSTSTTAITTNEELVFFKNILQGGIVVLDIPSCERQFEIYATINITLKDLNDKKILILLGYLSELTRLLKRDLVAIENEILNNESNAFLVRIDIQITKILTQLLSNNKIMLNFWKKTKVNFDLAKWCINHSSSLILKPTISKSLITANLQLIKDHKLHSYLNTPVQEFILYALLNMKFFNSSSLLVERLYTLKSLIINHTLMMEKNSKSWLPFLFNCLCDFNSSIYQKQQQVAVQCLLEASKLYLTSRNVNFEIYRSLTSPIHKILNIEPQTQISINSTPLDLQQTTFTYITNRSLELLEDQSKVSMDLWLGITLLFYSSNESLSEMPIEIDGPWYSILKRALESQSDEVVNNGIRAYKGMFYILCKNGKFPECLDLMFNGVKLIKKDFEDDEFLSNFMLQMVYALFNNSSLAEEHFPQMWSHVDALFDDFSGRNETLQKHVTKTFSHLVYQQQRQYDPFYLIKCLGNDKFNINEIQPLQPNLILKNHEIIWQTFIKSIWNSNESTKVKVHSLFTLMSSIRNATTKDHDNIALTHIFGTLETYQNFIPAYLKSINQFSDTDRSTYVERFLLNIRNIFGNRAFMKDVNGFPIFNNSNIYVTMVLNHYNCPKPMFNESIKVIVSVVKSYQYKLYESLVINHKDNCIVQYLTNYLGSKIFEKSLPSFEIQSIGNTISNLDRDETLWKNYLSYITKCSTITPLQGISYLKIGSWSATEMVIFTKHINTHHKQLKQPFAQYMVTAVQSMSSIIAIDLFNKLLRDDEMWILNELKEHIYFHVMDPNEQYSNDVHFYGLGFFDKYLQKIQDFDNDEVDLFLVQGLELCEALKKNEKSLSTTPDVVHLIQNVIEILMKKSNGLNDFPKVKKFVEDQMSQLTQKNVSPAPVAEFGHDQVSKEAGPVLTSESDEIREAPTVSNHVDYDMSVDSAGSKNNAGESRDDTTIEEHILPEQFASGSVEAEKTQSDKVVDTANNGALPEVTQQDTNNSNNKLPEVNEEDNNRDKIVTEEAAETDDNTKDTVEIEPPLSLKDIPVEADNKVSGESNEDHTNLGNISREELNDENHDTVELEEQGDTVNETPVEPNQVEEPEKVQQEIETLKDLKEKETDTVDDNNDQEESQSKFNFKIGEFRKKVETFKEKKRLSKIVEEFNRSGIRPPRQFVNKEIPESANSSESISDSDPTNKTNVLDNGISAGTSGETCETKNGVSQGVGESVPVENDTLVIEDHNADDSGNIQIEQSNENSRDSNDVSEAAIDQEPQSSENSDKSQQNQQEISKNQNHIEKSGSVELTNDWTETASDDHVFYDAQTNMNRSPIQESTSSDNNEERFFDSQEKLSSPNKKPLEEPVDQVDETQEIPDSNEALVAHKEVGGVNGQEDKEVEKENEIPSDSMVLYSSPLRHIRSIAGPLSSIENQDQNSQNTPTKSAIKRRYPGYEDQHNSSDGEDVYVIDDAEFSKSFISSSPRKSTPKANIPSTKKQRVEDNSPGLDVLTPPDDNPAMKPINKITEVFNSLSDQDVSSLNDQEVYEIENKMLAFMMRLRNRK